MNYPQESKLHLYSLALFTAVLSAVLSVPGFYFTSKIRAAAAIEQKRFEYRSEAYSSFIKAVNAKNLPTIAELLNLGKLADHIATDSEIQIFENRLAELSNENFEYRLSWELRSHFSTLHIHGSERVRQICDDIVSVIALREYEVEWVTYSEETQIVRERWLRAKDGVAYVWEPKVSDDERVMFVLVSELYLELLDILKEELHGA